MTAARSVPIVVEGPEAVTSDLKLWGHAGLIHHCDGIHFLSPDERIGKLCKCPQSAADRRAQAKSGYGPHPSTNIFFRLADNFFLGVFKFHSTSWLLAENIQNIRNTLLNSHDKVLCELSIETVEFTPADGGLSMRYRKPAIKELTPRNEQSTS
ncbi:hypothetical protein JK363_05840 [Streptomyces sp. 205]|uniref:Uncharacterized protein n=2 Tax=Streptomyces coffeae TaxID=621382 RepID=A0ABS1N8D5_9ACTN|nr:hypothetical protein [Streptomyces coffeae]